MTRPTLEERERRAYADGDLVLCEVLQQAQDEIEDMVEDELAYRTEQAHKEGYQKAQADAMNV